MFTKFHNRQKGFTLIELMIVVVIIGILAALAIPRFMQVTDKLEQSKSKQSGAKQLLKQVHLMEDGYRTTNGRYTANFDALGIRFPDPDSVGYTCDLVACTDMYRCTLTANLDDDAILDTWVVDETGVVTNIINDLTG